MSKSFKALTEAKPTEHFRVLEQESKIIKRSFKTDNSYIDTPIEEDLELHALVLGMDDVYF